MTFEWAVKWRNLTSSDWLSELVRKCNNLGKQSWGYTWCLCSQIQSETSPYDCGYCMRMVPFKCSNIVTSLWRNVFIHVWGLLRWKTEDWDYLRDSNYINIPQNLSWVIRGGWRVEKGDRVNATKFKTRSKFVLFFISVWIKRNKLEIVIHSRKSLI